MPQILGITLRIPPHTKSNTNTTFEINPKANKSTGSVINFITLGMLQEINIKMTSEDIHEKFEAECSILMNIICKLKDKNNQLEQIKKQYLNKFFG